MRALFVLLAVAAMVSASPREVRAESEDARPAFKLLRYDEDWSVMCDPARRTDPLDALKCVPLDDDGVYRLSLGGDARLRYENTGNPEWGQAPQDTHGVFLQRYRLHADAHAGDHVRAFLELASSMADGRKDGPSPVDEDLLDLSQAFLELSAPLPAVAGDDQSLGLRLGRQEVRLGSGRLVDVREGPNVRRKFDGGRVLLTAGPWQVDGLFLRPVRDERWMFEDETDANRALWGLHAAGSAPRLGVDALSGLDLYYLGYRSEAENYAQGTAEETRHSLGARLHGEADGFDANLESLVQFGSFGHGDILAWTAASVVGYTWEAAPLFPRAALSLNVASGDDDPDDADLQTFNPMFPRGNYFSELALLGPRNFWNIHPLLTVHPHDDVAVTADVNLFWRLSTRDGVYAPNGNLLRAPNGSDKTFVSTMLSLTGEWEVSRHLSATAIYSHDFPGEFIQDTGKHEGVDFVELTLRFIF